MVFMLSLVVYSLAFLCSPQQCMACCADCKNAFILKNKNNFYLTRHSLCLFYFGFFWGFFLRHRSTKTCISILPQRISLGCDVASYPPEAILPHPPFFPVPRQAMASEMFHSAGQRGQLRILGWHRLHTRTKSHN